MANTLPKSSDVRQWARSKGMEVGERGRLSPEVLTAYAAAHGGPAVKTAAKPAKKTAAKKSAAKKSAAKKRPAQRAAVKQAPARSGNGASPRVSNPPRESVKPALVASPPAVTVDSARVAALEAQIAKLSTRLEGLESARATGKKKGLFSRK